MCSEDYQGAPIELKASSYSLKPANYSMNNFYYINSSMKPYITTDYASMKSVTLSSKYYS
jgi:hypothetical protein